jgi:plasmid stabilization system protein ParE
MTEYNVIIAPHVISQIKNTILYISDVLQNKEAANSLLDQIKTAINKLKYFPESKPIAQNIDLGDKDIRKMVFKNYIAYFIVEKNKKEVVVIALLNCRMNQDSQLKELSKFIKY